MSVVPQPLCLTRRKMGAALPKGAARSEQEQGGRTDGSTTSQALLTESMLNKKTSNNFSTLPTPSQNGQGSTLNDCQDCKMSYSNVIERNVFLKVTDEFFDIILNQTTVRCGALSAFT